jgi:hypothetical protein
MTKEIVAGGNKMMNLQEIEMSRVLLDSYF